MEVTREKFPKWSKKRRERQQEIEDAASSRRASMRKISDKLCEECKDKFAPVKSWQKFCKSSCRMKSFNNAQALAKIGKENEEV